AMDRYQHAGADQLERRVEMIAMKLGFTPSDLERDVRTLSGGERGRLSLGVVLAGEPEVLFLDEPTNHLDLETIEWLANTCWAGEVRCWSCRTTAHSWTRCVRSRWSSGARRSAAIPCPTRNTTRSARRTWSASGAWRRSNPPSSARPRISSAKTWRGRIPNRHNRGGACWISSSVWNALKTCGRAPSACAFASPRPRAAATSCST